VLTSVVCSFCITEAAATSTDELEVLNTAKLPQLKAMCKERGLKVSGKKAELIERLREDFANSPVETADEKEIKVTNADGFSKMTVKDLRDACVARNLLNTGKKKELIQRLQDDIEYTKELQANMQPQGHDGYVAVSRIMEEAAKQGSAFAEFMAATKSQTTVVRKFVDVTIKSLGLTPEKYTVGGAPSVTTDVLRSLAGDPYADPPKYGKVR
jgi:SAP domain